MAISQQKRARIYDRDGRRCVVCGCDEEPLLTLDHIFPRAYGGSDNDGNLQTLCSPCNQAKADTLPDGLTKRQRKKMAQPKPHDKPRLRLGTQPALSSIGIRLHHRDCHPVWGCSMHCPVDGAMGRCVA